MRKPKLRVIICFQLSCRKTISVPKMMFHMCRTMERTLKMLRMPSTEEAMIMPPASESREVKGL